MQTSFSEVKRAPFFLARLLDNPIIAKELKGRMRGRQGATLITVYLGLLALFVALAYWFLDAEGSLSRSDPDFLQQAGKLLFGTVALSELLMIAFIGPALTSGAISSERERQTFDLLRVSLLAPRELLLGKLGSALAYLILLIFTAIPLQSLAFFVGGVGVAELLISLAMLIASAFLFCALGLYFSVVSKRAMSATALSYGTVVLPIALGFLFLFMFASSSPTGLSSAEERLLLLTAWTIFSTNPLSAAVLSELMFVEERSLLLFYPPGMHPRLALLSPWFLYLVYAFALTAIMLALSASSLKRYEY